MLHNAGLHISTVGWGQYVKKDRQFRAAVFFEAPRMLWGGGDMRVAF
jgi:hypothetical protein